MKNLNEVFKVNELVGHDSRKPLESETIQTLNAVIKVVTLIDKTPMEAAETIRMARIEAEKRIAKLQAMMLPVAVKTPEEIQNDFLNFCAERGN